MLVWIKANRERLENWLATATAALFAAAVCANVGLFFSVWQSPSALGRFCSWAYLIAWVLSAVFLRNQPQWLKIIRRTRWTAIGAILLGLIAGASGGYGLLSMICVMPYALFVSAYRGFSQAAWCYYFLPLAQALTASLLSRRLRRKRARNKGKDGQR